jgi:Bacterial Ig domain
MRTLKSISLSVALCTAAACAQIALAQAPTPDAATASSTSPVATVYVAYTPKNSNGNEIAEYSVAPNGALTPLPGSPYSGNVTSMAVNGKYLFGPNKSAPYIETYTINSSGELHWVAEENYLQTDPGSDCGSAGPVFPDRTGQSLYLMDFDGDCANNYYESFAVNPSSGHLSFTGTANGGAPSFEGISLAASFLNNDLYAYTTTNGCMYNAVWAFRRGSNGALSTWGASDVSNASGFTFTPPAAPSGVGGWCYEHAAADPSGHVAIGMQPFTGPSSAQGPLQIGSFTADSNGSLTTTNTAATMPATSVTYALALTMDPSGQLLAVGGQGGLQVFHFNGANPPTKFTPLLTTDTILAAYWDNNNHLFAISQTSNKLYEFNVTPTGYSAAPGSPWTVADPQDLAVNPLATNGGGGGCSAPASAGVNLCSPASGATVNSPVQVTATGTVTGTFSQMELWVDGVRKYSESTSPALNTSISLSAGQHRFAVLAVNTSGQVWEKAVDATVQSSGTCSAPGSPGVNLCSPANGATVNSPVQVAATANVSGTLSQMELWVDGVEKFSESSSSTLQTSVSLGAGTHRFAVLAVNTSGQKWEQAVNATVQ